MQALIYSGAKQLEVQDNFPIPVAGKGEVKLKIAYCGICGTDLHEYEAGPILCPSLTEPHKITGEKLPIPMGHEMSGTIVELGEDLKGKWKVGDRVVVEPTISCYECPPCSLDARNACTSLGFIGLSGRGGGLSEFISVDERLVHKLPDHVSLEVGAMVEPLAVAWHAVKSSGFKKGQTALVMGAGPIGLFTLAVLRAFGAKAVYVSEMSGTRSKAALKAGADAVLNPKEVDVTAKILELTKPNGADGVDVAFEAAGVQATFDTALKCVRTRGTLLNIAIWSKSPTINMNAVTMKEMTLKAVICYDKVHQEVIQALSEGKLDIAAFVTSKVALKDVVDKGFHELIHNNENHIKILVSPTGA